MTDERETIVVGFPTDERLRAEIARVHPSGLKPMIYAGAVKRRCDHCNLELWVGPKQHAVLAQDPGLRLLCPWCMVKEAAKSDSVGVDHLGNPETRHEH